MEDGSHCKTYRITGLTGSHQIGLVIGFKVRDRVKVMDRVRALGFSDRVRVKFRVRIRVRAWSGMTLLTLCPCTFCSDPSTDRNLNVVCGPTKHCIVHIGHLPYSALVSTVCFDCIGSM